MGNRSRSSLVVAAQNAAFSAAARTIGVTDLYPHQLRHTAASLAIASGADVKVVQQMLGHASATMTLDTYGHLFEDRLDEVGDALDRARETARQRRELLPRVAPVLPERDFDGNAEAVRPSVSAGQTAFQTCTPDRIRTGATALRGRRARPLHNGGVCPAYCPGNEARL